MPRRNGTGPMGMGMMTGRGAGNCEGYGAPGFVNQAPGRGPGRRCGGRGFFGGAGAGRGWMMRGAFSEWGDSQEIRPMAQSRATARGRRRRWVSTPLETGGF